MGSAFCALLIFLFPATMARADDGAAPEPNNPWDVTSAPLVVDDSAPTAPAPESTDDGPSSGTGQAAGLVPRGENPKAEAAIDTESSTADEEDLTGKFSANYFAILYGSSIQSPGEFQPSPFGERDPSRPMELKNFAGVSYNLDKDTAITPTAYWSWYAGEQQFTMNDPFLRISRANVIDTTYFNLYSDLRIHIPVSSDSQSDKLVTGLQTFQSLAFQVGQTPLALGLYASVRVNFFGDQGLGNDLELYMGPNLFFQIARHMSLTLLYEEQVNHQYGAKPFHFWTPGSDLEPGVAWDVTSNLMINPYFNLNTGGQIALSTTSFGMMLNWRMF